MRGSLRGGTPKSRVGSFETPLGERVRLLRERFGMTQAELAGTEMTASFISQIERGRRTPTAEYLEIIAGRLEVPTVDLVDGVDRELRVTVLLRLAELLLVRGGEADRVKTILEEVRPLLVTARDSIQFEFISAQLLVEQREFSAGLKKAYEALALAEETHDVEMRIKTLQIVVHTYSRMAKQDSALPHAIKAVELADEPQVPASLKARAHANLATVQLLIGDIGAAVIQYEIALRIAGDARDLVVMAHAETFLGEAARERNDWVGAIQHLERGLALAARLDLNELWVTSLHNLGQSYLNIGDTATARLHQEKAFDEARRFRFDRIVPMTAEQMAQVELKEGHPERARAIAADALELAEEIGDDCFALVLTRLAEATAHLDGIKAADELFDRANQVAADGSRWEHMPQASVLREIRLAWGNAHRAHGDKDKALDLYYAAATLAVGGSLNPL